MPVLEYAGYAHGSVRTARITALHGIAADACICIVKKTTLWGIEKRMSFINKEVRRKLDRSGVSVFFVSGAVTKWYNAQRSDPKTQVALLGGWYWSLGTEEHGPFRTPSAAERDFYYRHLLRIRPPCLSQHDVATALREIYPPAPAKKKRAA